MIPPENYFQLTGNMLYAISCIDSYPLIKKKKKKHDKALASNWTAQWGQISKCKYQIKNDNENTIFMITTVPVIAAYADLHDILVCN